MIPPGATGAMGTQEQKAPPLLPPPANPEMQNQNMVGNMNQTMTSEQNSILANYQKQMLAA